MNIKFSKMHGLGNDFMVLDAVNQSISLSPKQIRDLANRHRGVGFDQMLLVEPPKRDDYDFYYRIYNADGSEAYQCGNGARCIAKFIRDNRLSDKKELTVATKTSHHRLILNDDGNVTVDMGVPILEPKQIPFMSEHKRIIYPLNIKQGDFEVCVVSMGNPHCIFTVDDINHIDLPKMGRAISEHEKFPERTNVEFMQVVSRDHVRLRIYERGVGETEACGSGACAAMVAGILQNTLGEKVTITMPGGDLHVEWAGGDNPVWMTGPASLVFTGELS